MGDNFDIDALKAGCAVEFKRVYHYYEPRLNGYFITKGSSKDLNADVIQQTFIKLWVSRKRLNTDVKLSTQIFQIAKTTMIDELRRQHTITRRKQLVPAYLDYQKENVIHSLEEKETHYQLNRAIDQLPPVRRKVFLLSREDNMSHKEISARLSISVKTVNKHIQLAIKQIKPYIHIIEVLSIIFIHKL